MRVVLLREARERAGLSRETLAHMSGISTRCIYDIEHANRVPRRSTRIVLTTVLRHENGEHVRIDWPATPALEAAA